MKKRFLSMLAALAVLCIALVGCGGGEAPAPVDYTSNFAGKWEYVLVEGDNNLSEDDVQSMRDLGLNMDLILGEDGTWDFEMMGEVIVDGTWEAKDATTCTLTASGDTIDVTIDPDTGRLLFEYSNQRIYFERTGSAATSNSTSAGSGSSDSDSGKFGTVTPAPEPEPEPEPEPIDYSAPFVGDWVLVEMTADNPEDAVDVDTVAQLKDAGYVCVLSLYADGTFSIDFFGGDTMSGTWRFDSETGGSIDITSEGSSQHSPLEYDPSTGRFSIIESSDVLYFERY